MKTTQAKGKTATHSTKATAKNTATKGNPGEPQGHDKRAARKAAPAGAKALGPPEFVVNRRWGKPVASHVGARLRVELPENDRQGLNWQLQRLPHGVALESAELHPHSGAEGHQLTTHHRVFDFALEEAGDYVLQFDLSRPFSQQAKADTFKVKVRAD